MKKIWLMRKILTVLKKVSFCIKGSAKIRREKWLRLPVKNVGFSRIAGRCFCRNAIFLINIGGNAFMDCLIFERKIAVIFVIREKILQFTRKTGETKHSCRIFNDHIAYAAAGNGRIVRKVRKKEWSGQWSPQLNRYLKRRDGIFFIGAEKTRAHTDKIAVRKHTVSCEGEKICHAHQIVMVVEQHQLKQLRILRLVERAEHGNHMFSTQGIGALPSGKLFKCGLFQTCLSGKMPQDGERAVEVEGVFFCCCKGMCGKRNMRCTRSLAGRFLRGLPAGRFAGDIMQRNSGQTIDVCLCI